MSSSAIDSRAGQPGSVFAVLFIVCVVSAAGLLNFLPDPLLDAWRGLTIRLTRALAYLLGIATTRDGDIVTVNGFAMRIVDQCTASNYVVILMVAMLLYTRHRLPYRLLGIAVAVPVIMIANALRLIITGLVGSYSRSAFDLVHDYLWVIVFALLVFALWALWVNGRFAMSRNSWGKLGLVTGVSLAAFLLITLFQDSYGDLLALASSFFYRSFSQDAQASIVREGSQVFLTHGGAKFFLNTLMEQINVAVFIGLVAPLQRWGDWEMLVTSLLGLLAIVMVGALFIALGCCQAVASGTAGLEGFLRVGSFVNLAIPLAMYWVMAAERARAGR